MMRSLDDFRVSIEMLLANLAYEKESQIFFKDGFQRYIGDSDFESEFRSFVESVVSGSALRTRVYSYQSSIISLYGYLERFVEDVVVEYLRCISDVCPEYGLLPLAIRKNHLPLSMDLINKIQKMRGAVESDRKTKLSVAVGNMNHFLGEQGELKLNYDAFVSHSSNFRYDTIHDVFNRIGIEAVSRQCLSEQHLLDALYERSGIEGEASVKTLISHLMNELDDLAQRRNEVAHGVRIDDIDSPELTVSRIKLIESYVVSIAAVVERYVREYTFEISPRLLIGKPDCMFSKINVIGFEGIRLSEGDNASYRVGVGDTIFAVNEESQQKFISGKIISLKYNGVDQEVISIPCEVDVSMKLDVEVSESFKKRLVFIALGGE